MLESRDGPFKLYYTSNREGTYKDREGTYKDRKLEQQRTFYTNGKLRREETFTNGNLDGLYKRARFSNGRHY